MKFYVKEGTGLTPPKWFTKDGIELTGLSRYEVVFDKDYLTMEPHGLRSKGQQVGISKTYIKSIMFEFASGREEIEIEAI